LIKDRLPVRIIEAIAATLGWRATIPSPEPNVIDWRRRATMPDFRERLGNPVLIRFYDFWG
jgi:hypothetical protein